MISNEDGAARFLESMQRLIIENDMMSTYKLALVLAVMRRALDPRPDYFCPDGLVRISYRELAREFLRLYWHQAREYCWQDSYGRQQETLLVQANNQHGNARIFTLIQDFCKFKYAPSSDKVRPMSYATACRTPEFEALVNRCMHDVVVKMPLKYIHSEKVLFEKDDRLKTVVLKPETIEFLTRFEPMITELIESRWESFVRNLKPNKKVFSSDGKLSLRAFLFHPGRTDSLSEVRGMLQEACDQTHCFYCGAPLRESNVHVDHFLPYTRYYPKQIFNFVLSCQSCNSSKSDHLVSANHLEHWIERNERYADDLIEISRGEIESGVIAVPHKAYDLYRRAGERHETFWQKRLDKGRPLMTEFESSVLRLLGNHVEYMQNIIQSRGAF